MNDGFLIVDKPTGMTSHDVVGKCRRIVGQRRIGHSGTLDPGATGILLVALGRVTRLIRFMSDLPKTYRGEVVLGTTTSTLDNEGEVTATFDMGDVSLDEIRKVAEKFVGDIMQVPPMVSALKVDGKRLHELAREGIEVERKARPVTIHSLTVEPTDRMNVFEITASVSSGTYIRTLAADIGEALGGGAHLQNLRRTSIGPFDEARSVSLDELEKGWEIHAGNAADAVSHLPRLTVDEQGAMDVGYGRKLRRDNLQAEGDGPWAVVNGEGELLAVYEVASDTLLGAGVVIANN